MSGFAEVKGKVVCVLAASGLGFFQIAAAHVLGEEGEDILLLMEDILHHLKSPKSQESQ